MSSPAYTNRPPDEAISEASPIWPGTCRWSFNHAADQLWEGSTPNFGTSPTTHGSSCKRYRAKDCARLPLNRASKSCWLIFSTREKPPRSLKGGFKKRILVPAFRRLPISPWNLC